MQRLSCHHRRNASGGTASVQGDAMIIAVTTEVGVVTVEATAMETDTGVEVVIGVVTGMVVTEIVGIGEVTRAADITTNMTPVDVMTTETDMTTGQVEVTPEIGTTVHTTLVAVVAMGHGEVDRGHGADPASRETGITSLDGEVTGVNGAPRKGGTEVTVMATALTLTRVTAGSGATPGIRATGAVREARGTTRDRATTAVAVSGTEATNRHVAKPHSTVITTC